MKPKKMIWEKIKDEVNKEMEKIGFSEYLKKHKSDKSLKDILKSYKIKVRNGK